MIGKLPMPAPKSLSSAQKPVMTEGGTPNSLLRTLEGGLVLRDLLAPGGDAVRRGELGLEVEEGLREELLAAVARGDLAVDAHAVEHGIDGVRADTGGGGVLFETREPGRKALGVAAILVGRRIGRALTGFCRWGDSGRLSGWGRRRSGGGWRSGLLLGRGLLRLLGLLLHRRRRIEELSRGGADRRNCDQRRCHRRTKLQRVHRRSFG